MPFHLCDFHSSFPVDHWQVSIFGRIRWAPRSSRGGSGVDGQLRLDHVCWLQVHPSQPCSLPGHGAASTASLQASCCWCCWPQARWAWWCAQFTAFLHADPGTRRQGWAPSIWRLTAVAITHFGFNYCLELLDDWLAMHLLDWLFSKYA